MNSTERIESRLKRVDMHDFFMNRINMAIKEGRNIEASWLIYSCLENRYFRTVEKIKKECKYKYGKCNRSDNRLSIRTKIECIQHLTEYGCECFEKSFDKGLFKKTLKWVDERNTLMHNLLQLHTYNNMDEKFKKICDEGIVILKETYNSCTEFRKIFYDKNYSFEFPKEIMEKCRCSRSKG